MEKYVVFIDVDGTLVDSTYVPAERVVDALKRAQKAGHKIFICTARQKRTVPEGITKLFVPDGYVCTTGQFVEADGNVIRDISLEYDLVMLFADCVKKKKYSGRFILNDYEIPIQNGAFDETLVEKEAKAGRIVKFGLNEDLDREATDLLSKCFTVHQYIKWCEISKKECNKAHGIERVMEHYGMDISRCIAIGDSINDIEMIGAAGIGVAMGNADPKLKNVADYVTDSLEDDGVATALEHLLKI